MTELIRLITKIDFYTWIISESTQEIIYTAHILSNDFRIAQTQNMNLPLSHAASFVLSRAARPILSFGITRFNISSEPSEFAIASCVNSIKCSFTKENLKQIPIWKKIRKSIM